MYQYTPQLAFLYVNRFIYVDVIKFDLENNYIKVESDPMFTQTNTIYLILRGQIRKFNYIIEVKTDTTFLLLLYPPLSQIEVDFYKLLQPN